MFIVNQFKDVSCRFKMIGKQQTFFTSDTLAFPLTDVAKVYREKAN